MIGRPPSSTLFPSPPLSGPPPAARPYDHDYGDARYAREDTREALRQARLDGITPFCVTIDRDSEAELRDLYGEVGYTIIDDVLSLPERMPAIYRRLTT